MKSYQQSFLLNHFGKTVEELWTDFAKTLDKLSQECIPSKIIRGKSSLPWITQEIKRLIRKRDSLYTKFKKSGDQDTKTKFQTLRQHIKKKIKDSYQGYLENLLGLNDSDNTCDSKNFSPFRKTHVMINRAYHRSNTTTYSTLIPRPKQTSLINSLTLFLHLRNPYHSLALPKCGCRT